MTYKLKKIKVLILGNESENDHLLWVKACKKRDLNFDVVDISKANWIVEIRKGKYDLFLLKPPGISAKYKQIYDERLWIIKETFKTPIYPSLSEVFVYENKRLLSGWLAAKNIDHPRTWVFYSLKESLNFCKKFTNFPIVAKTNIGASGNGVSIIKDSKSLNNYIYKSFKEGIRSKTGPNLFKGSILKKFLKVLNNKSFLKNRIKEYASSAKEVQKGFILLQEFIPHEFEWRCVVIGDSFFAHKKVKVGNKTSGALIKDYSEVPIRLLNFIREFSIKNNMKSVAIDIFETDSKFLINEIQTFFGQSDPYQMLINNEPGRYRYIEKKWLFEKGMFNTNECYDLRLKEALKLIK